MEILELTLSANSFNKSEPKSRMGNVTLENSQVSAEPPILQWLLTKKYLSLTFFGVLDLEGANLSLITLKT